MAEHSKKEMSVYALIVALATGGGGFVGVQQAIEVADGHWMTHDQHAARELKDDIKQLRREIRELEYKVQEGTATDHEKWKLNDLKEELQEATDEQT